VAAGELRYQWLFGDGPTSTSTNTSPTHLYSSTVSAGEHTVEMIFRPLSFTIGAVISGLSIILIIVIAFLPGVPHNF
jgi:hypothetical protein